MDLPPYFDSQAQAAAMLRISIYDVKAAKAAGCPAFRGGRIRTKEFRAWLKDDRIRKACISDLDNDVPCANWPDRADRRSQLFDLMEYLEGARYEKQISEEEYCALRDKTIPLVIKLSRVWGAGIDEPGYKKTCGYNKKPFRRKAKKNSE